MFTEVIKIKGLIVYLKQKKFELDIEWKSITEIIPCSFIVENEEQQIELSNLLSSEVKFSKEEFTFFGANQTINKAIKDLALQPYEVACVTNDLSLIRTLVNEPIGTILLHSGSLPFEYHGFAPDFVIGSLSDLRDILSDEIKGFFSEVSSTFLRKNRNGHPEILGDSGFYCETELPELPYNLPNCNLLIMGRYYDPGHFKYQAHQLSHRIRRSKEENSQDHIFADLFRSIIIDIKPDGITRVPPRPSRDRDRLQPVVTTILNGTDIEDHCESLKCIRDYPEHKSLSREARYENVEGVFSASSHVKGKHIVLIDDVLTTGATVTSCAKELIESGARKVTILVLASHQFTPQWSTRKTFKCNKCDGTLKLTLKKDNSFFYGCDNYRHTKCKGALDFVSGWHSICKLNVIDTNDVFDANFDGDFEF